MTGVDPSYVLLESNRYRVDRFWGEFPEGELGLVSQLAVDSKGAVYVFQRAGPPVVVFEPNGVWRASWGQGVIADPHGISIDRHDRIWLVDRDSHQVLCATPDGEIERVLGERHYPNFQAPFNHPTAVALAEDDEIYVADGYGNACIHRFSPAGEWRQTWGRPGVGPGEFSTPHGVCIDSLNRVLVADRENDRVQLFSRDGIYLSQWGGFYHPMDLCEETPGRVLVTDQIPRLSLMSPNGELLGRCRPVWNTPHGIAKRFDGDIFLTEMNPSSITRLALLKE